MFEVKSVCLTSEVTTYSLQQDGTIVDNTDNLVKSELIDDELFVELDWILGKRKYLVSLVLLVGFNKCNLPIEHLDQVEPLYLDGDKTNVSLDNLFYRYRNGPIEVTGHPGFYHIPFYSRYALSRDGQLFNWQTGKPKTWATTKENVKGTTGGYSYTRVVNDTGKSVCLFIHRALCLAFKPYDRTVLSIVVNHIDGKPRNNKLDNLEWSTWADNSKHAYRAGLRPNSSRPILMKNLRTGEETRYSNSLHCARELGHKSATFIQWRLSEPTKFKVYPDFLLFKDEGDKTPWPLINPDEVKYCRLGSKGSAIVAKNIFTGIVTVYYGAIKASEGTGVGSSVIHDQCRGKESLPYGGFNFRYLEEAGTWPEHSARHLLIFKEFPFHTKNGGICLDTVTGIDTFYTSVEGMAKDLGRSLDYIKRLVREKTLFQERYRLTYFNVK